MPRIYAFFRSPDGTPDRSHDGSGAPVHLLAEVGKLANKNPDGSVSWPGGTINRLEVPIRSKVGIFAPEGGELNQDDTWRIFWTAIVGIAKSNPGKAVLPSRLFQEVNKAAAQFFRQPFASYSLVSSLSVKSLPSTRIRIGSTTITQLKTRATRYPIPDFALRRFPHLQAPAVASKYLLVKVSTRGRSIFEAAESALDSLNLLRAIWSLFFTYGSWSMSFGISPRKPLGVIHTGVLHTLHPHSGGSIPEEVCWYDPDSSDDRPLFDPGDKWPLIESRRKWVLSCLSRITYADDVKGLLVRYILALDHSDPQVAFLRMWSILERITDTVGAGYDQTIDRALWAYVKESRGIAKDMLDSLRIVRNRYVHSGAGDQQPDQVAYLVKSFVDPHLIRLLANPFGANSIKEHASCFSFPVELAALKRKRAAIPRAIAFVTKK